MPVTDRFKMLDGNDVADLTGSDDLPQSRRIFGVAQHMADGEHHSGFFHGIDDTLT